MGIVAFLGKCALFLAGLMVMLATFYKSGWGAGLDFELGFLGGGLFMLARLGLALSDTLHSVLEPQTTLRIMDFTLGIVLIVVVCLAASIPGIFYSTGEFFVSSFWDTIAPIAIILSVFGGFAGACFALMPGRSIRRLVTGFLSGSIVSIGVFITSLGRASRLVSPVSFCQHGCPSGFNLEELLRTLPVVHPHTNYYITGPLVVALGIVFGLIRLRDERRLRI